MLSYKQVENAAMCVVPPVLFKGTAIMVSFMIVGLAMICYSLGVLAHKLKRPSIIVLLVIDFVCSLCMGYLASKDFDKAYWNWIAEGINIVGQGAFLMAAIELRKAGLSKLKL